MGVKRVICPLGAGVASAFGFLASPTSFEFVRAAMQPLEALDLAAIADMVAELEAKAAGLIARAGVEPSAATTSVSALMRYVGQGYEVEVAVPRGVIDGGNQTAVARLFADRYRALHGREEQMAVEIISWRVVVAGPRPQLEPSAATREGEARLGTRAVYFAEAAGFVETPVFDRYRIRPGESVQGPAVLEERESTIIVPPDATATANEFGSLIIDLT
jgi:N-methylhydantoinase A